LTIIYVLCIYVCFVVLAITFDRVDLKKLVNALRRIVVDLKDRRLAENLYMGQKVRKNRSSNFRNWRGYR